MLVNCITNCFFPTRPEEDYYDNKNIGVVPHHSEALEACGVPFRTDNTGKKTCKAGYHNIPTGVAYVSCGGNWIVAYKGGNLTAGGRRHGIPWGRACGDRELVIESHQYVETSTPHLPPMGTQTPEESIKTVKTILATSGFGVPKDASDASKLLAAVTILKKKNVDVFRRDLVEWRLRRLLAKQGVTDPTMVTLILANRKK